MGFKRGKIKIFTLKINKIKILKKESTIDLVVQLPCFRI